VAYEAKNEVSSCKLVQVENIMDKGPTNELVVRIDPPKFWSATRLMTKEERDTLLEAITKLAEAGDTTGLAHFDFIACSVRPDPVAA
jgi:hypothetical protein